MCINEGDMSMDGKIPGCGREDGEFQKESDDVLKHKPILETTYASPERFHKRVDAYMRYLQGGVSGGDGKSGEGAGGTQ